MCVLYQMSLVATPLTNIELEFKGRMSDDLYPLG